MSPSGQPGPVSDADDAYLTWQDLLDEEDDTDVGPATAGTTPGRARGRSVVGG